MARQAKFKTYDMTVGIHNAKLKVIARNVLNSDVPIRYKISLRDDILAMKEKERLGFNFNRSLAASLRSRWDVVENATKSFLQEIVDMNDQIEEDSKKNERQLMGLIFTRSTNLGLESRVEQMGGLYMRVNFYKSVLEEKINQLEPFKNFLSQCCELMGYLQPGQLLDRYAALNHVFKELYREYDDRISTMNKLQERLSDIKSETDHRNMLMHNEMSDLHMNLKALITRITYMEFELHERIDQCTGSEMELYNIKNSIHRSYVSLMLYRGMDPTDTDPFVQLDHIATRIKTTQEVIRMIREENQRRDYSMRRFRREKDGDQPLQAPESVSSLETVDDNENRYDYVLIQDANSNWWLDDVSWAKTAHANPVSSSNRSKYECGLPPLRNSTCGLTGRMSHAPSQKRQYSTAIIGQSPMKSFSSSPGVSPRKKIQNVSASFGHIPKIEKHVNESLKDPNVIFSHPDQVGATYKITDGHNELRYDIIRTNETTRRSSEITRWTKLEDREMVSKFKCLLDARDLIEAKQNHNFNKLQTMTNDLLPTKAAMNDFQNEADVVNDGSRQYRQVPSRDLGEKERNLNNTNHCKVRLADDKKCRIVPKVDKKEHDSNKKMVVEPQANKFRLSTKQHPKKCAEVAKKMEPSRDAGTAHKVAFPWLCRREKLKNYLEISKRFPVDVQQTTCTVNHGTHA